MQLFNVLYEMLDRKNCKENMHLDPQIFYVYIFTIKIKIVCWKFIFACIWIMSYVD